MKAIFEREFRSYFTSVSGYLFAAFLLLFTGIYTMSVCLVGGYANYEYVLGNMTFIFLLIVPVITMKSFAEERRQRTDQLLYSLPIGMTKVVFGKYLALLAVFAVPTLVTCIYPIILNFYGDVSFRTIFVTYIGFFLLGASLLAIGMFISSLTESLPLAAGGTFLVLLLDFFASSLSSYLSVGGDLLTKLCLFDLIDDFVYGVLNIKSIVLFLSVIGFFVFLTIQACEKRRWS
jgi:ABC-2 type transport system permease protein